MPLDLGPVQFQLVGTFMDKPRLLLNGEEVPYESLHASYRPAETYEYKDMDGKEVKEEYPEHIALSFSLTSQIGQLEVGVSYRVKANAVNEFVLEAVAEGDDVHAAKKPDFFKKKDEKSKDSKKDSKDKKEDSPKKKDDKKDGKPDFFKKKGKSALLRSFVPDAGTRMHRQNVNSDILRNLVEDND